MLQANFIHHHNHGIRLPCVLFINCIYQFIVIERSLYVAIQIILLAVIVWYAFQFLRFWQPFWILLRIFEKCK